MNAQQRLIALWGMNTRRRLSALFDVILDEAEENTRFARNLEAVLDRELASNQPPTSVRGPMERRGGRRPSGVLDPFAVYAQGEVELRRQLAQLSVEELKDIVAEHGMDPTKLALKWKTPERLIDVICQRVSDRVHKGQAFEA